MLRAKTSQGIIEGEPKNGYTVFFGVPYAQAPLGALRFMAPQPLKADPNAVFRADTFPPRAPQSNFDPHSFYGKEFYADPQKIPSCREDCLRLNIWTPDINAKTPFPVAVWIHGGAFRHGFASEIEFDGEAYCKRGIVLVSIQYRLGAIGYLSHPWLNVHGCVSANRGLLDQIAALKWVQENISSFGGDPKRVTVMGQSAGSFSVQALLCAQAAKGLFHKAVLQSGGGYLSGINRDIPLQDAWKIGKDYVDQLNITCLDELIECPWEKLVNGQDGFRFSPVIDGDISAGFDDLLEAGHFQDIPCLVGCTKDDLHQTEETRRGNAEAPLHRGFRNFCVLKDDLHMQPGFMYEFRHNLPGDKAGAFHSSELWYMFGTLSRSWRPMTEGDRTLSENMLDAWASFIKTGDPGWPACTRKHPFIQHFE